MAEPIAGPESIPAAPAPVQAPGGWRRVFVWMRRTAAVLTILYAGTLVVLLGALEWWGERNWLLSLLMFAPPQALLSPLAALTPFCLIFRARWVLVHIGCALLLCFGFMTYRWNSRPADRSGALAVLTHNVGQGNRAQFVKFVEQEKPDIVLLQDARNRGPDYIKTWPERYVAGRGEFYAVSRYQIRRAELVPQPQWRGRPVAARFEVDYQGQPVALYNVHLPTPRSQFNRFLSKRAVADLFGDDEQGKTFQSYREWIAERRKLAQDLAQVFAAEKLPFLACGDFNTPDHGFIYHVFADDLTDAHAAAGSGWGMSFPGDVKSLVAIFGPWLRIDYAFAGHGWRPVHCQTESGTRSQHRALSAQFVPLPTQ